MLVHDNFPTVHEVDYSVLASRSDGEKALGYIAANSSREFLWTFTEEYGVWRNHTVEHFEDRKFKGGRLWQERLGATIPNDIMFPGRLGTSIYHNHPPAPASFSFPDLRTQLPSSEDIAACVRLCLNGYEDFRIATRLGITTMQLNPAAVERGAIKIKGFSMTPEVMQRWEAQLGTIGSIQKAIQFFAERFEEQVHIEFNPFSST